MNRFVIGSIILLLALAACVDDSVEIANTEYFRKALPRDGWNSLNAWLFDNGQGYTFGSPYVSLSAEQGIGLYDAGSDGRNIVSKVYANEGANQLIYAKGQEKKFVFGNDGNYFLDEVDDKLRPLNSFDIMPNRDDQFNFWIESLDIAAEGNLRVFLINRYEFATETDETIVRYMDKGTLLWERVIPRDSLGLDFIYPAKISLADDGTLHAVVENYTNTSYSLYKLQLNSTGKILSSEIWGYNDPWGLQRIGNFHHNFTFQCDNDDCYEYLQVFDDKLQLIYRFYFYELVNPNTGGITDYRYFISVDQDDQRAWIRVFLTAPYVFDIIELDFEGNELQRFRGEKDVFYNHIQIDDDGNYLMLVDIQIIDGSYTTYLVKNPPEDPFSFY